MATFVNLAMASGEKLFGHFEVDESGPVIAYVGEGGRVPYTRRLERVAAAMGVKLADIPLFPRFDIALSHRRRSGPHCGVTSAPANPRWSASTRCTPTRAAP